MHLTECTNGQTMFASVGTCIKGSGAGRKGNMKCHHKVSSCCRFSLLVDAAEESGAIVVCCHHQLSGSASEIKGLEAGFQAVHYLLSECIEGSMSGAQGECLAWEVSVSCCKQRCRKALSLSCKSHCCCLRSCSCATLYVSPQSLEGVQDRLHLDTVT